MNIVDTNPEDPLSLQCSLLRNDLATELQKSSMAIQVKWCLEENMSCANVKGIIILTVLFRVAEMVNSKKVL